MGKHKLRMKTKDKMTKKLIEALKKQSIVEITYTSAFGETTTRNIVVASIGEQYVGAYCFLREETRMFRIDRIKEISTVVKHIDYKTIIAKAIENHK